MTELDTAGNVLGSPFVGANPWGSGFHGSHLWVANWAGSNVAELDAAGNVLGTFNVGLNPIGIAFDGTHLWVTNNSASSITELDTSGNVLGTFSVGSGNCWIVFDGTHIWVANVTGSSVTKLDTAGNVVATYNVGLNPIGIAFDGTHIWVTNPGSNTVQTYDKRAGRYFDQLEVHYCTSGRLFIGLSGRHAVGWYRAHQSLQSSRARFVASTLEPMAALLKENDGIITELQAEPFVEKDNGILESYLVKIRRDGVAKNAPMKQRLDQLAENNTALVTLHRGVCAARQDCRVHAGGQQVS